MTEQTSPETPEDQPASSTTIDYNGIATVFDPHDVTIRALWEAYKCCDCTPPTCRCCSGQAAVEAMQEIFGQAADWVSWCHDNFDTATTPDSNPVEAAKGLIALYEFVDTSLPDFDLSAYEEAYQSAHEVLDAEED